MLRPSARRRAGDGAGEAVPTLDITASKDQGHLTMILGYGILAVLGQRRAACGNASMAGMSNPYAWVSVVKDRDQHTGTCPRHRNLRPSRRGFSFLCMKVAMTVASKPPPSCAVLPCRPRRVSTWA